MAYGAVRITRRRRKRHTVKAEATRATQAALSGRTAGLGKAVETAATRHVARTIVGATVVPAARVISKGAGAVQAGLAAAGVSLPVAGLALLVGAAVYEGTSWLLDEAQSGRFDPAYRAAMAYRHAREALAADLHRKLNHDEEVMLARQFKKKLREVGPYKAGRVLKF